jgi:hypothetical protein
MQLKIRYHLYRCWLHYLCWLLLVLTAELQANNNDPVPIGLLPDIKNDYLLFLAGRNAIDINFYGGPHARRDVAELILLQQALHLGGFNQRLLFIEE